MAQSSTIEWTEATWNPIVGCSKVSAGCKHCYAERMSVRLAGMARAAEATGAAAGRKQAYQQVVNGRGRWNGRILTVDAALEDPFKWKSPRRIFVNSMSDLFHQDVPEEFVRRVFEVMNRCPQHVFQVLTKRPENALRLAPQLRWSENIWLGTSIEDATALHRVSDLANVPSSLRFLSLEPLLGPISGLDLRGIHWVIVGGESGPGARPMRVEWVREIQQICVDRGVPFFFKQWGGRNKALSGRTLNGRTWDELPRGLHDRHARS